MAIKKGPLAGHSAVLVVDDHKLVRNLVVRLLEEAGLSVMAVETGVAAIELVRQRPHEIGCVLQDLSMPNMRGEEVIVRMQEINPDLPIVAFSAQDDESAAVLLSGIKVAGFVRKPFDIKVLLDLILRLTSTAPPNADAAPGSTPEATDVP